MADNAAAELLTEQERARGGVCVIIGDVEQIASNPEGELGLAGKLLESGSWKIHWLDVDQQAVEDARRVLLERGLYGRVVVEHWTANHLPHADNLVNLVVRLEPQPRVNEGELLRVLAPEGFSVRADGQRTHKPRPEAMGEWTHPWHAADGSLASTDEAFDVPNAFQWIAGPPFPMAARKDSAGAILSAGGRVFTITQNVPENVSERRGDNHLVARDAFNGKVLWATPWQGPLSRGHWDAVHEAIVASADRVYTTREDEIAIFDAATGAELETWATRETADKLLLTDGLLIAQTPAGLTAFDIEGGSEAWHVDADEPWGVVAWDGQAFCLSSSRESDGQWQHTLLSVDLNNGDVLWREPVESRYGARGTAVLRLHFAQGGIVCLIERHAVRVLAADDGRELWQRESGTEARGGGRMDSRQVGHFFARGKVWMRMDRGRGQDGVEPWLALDPMTGEVVREVAARGDKGTITNVNKVSCQPLTATQRFVFDARLSTVWNFDTGERAGWKFARGGCQVGMVPANGLAYAPPNACGCEGEQLRGNLAVVRTEDPGINSFVPAPLQRGPAFGNVNSTDIEGAAWPTYRADGRRGAYLAQDLATDLSVRWHASVASEGVDADGEWRLRYGRPLTPPVAANGLVMFAEPQTHQVIALDEQSGEERWRFTAGGRVTTPPTIYAGLALIGAHNGYVYAVRAEDGELVWRQRVAPSDRRIMGYGQLESAWPVTGGVLIHDGVAIAAAGRAVDAEGGLVVRGLNPHNGREQWTRRVVDARHGQGDLLVTDDEHVYLMNMRLDAQTGAIVEVPFRTTRIEREWNEARLRRIAYPDGVRYLRSGQAGFSDTSWTQLDMGLRKHQSSWTWGETDGEILAFNEDTAFAFQIDAGERMWSRPRTDGGGRILAWTAGNERPDWTAELAAPEQIQAMFVTDNALFVAGPSDRGEPTGPGFVRAMGLDGGSDIEEIALPVAPVHDGVIASGGKIFAVLHDGSVICLEAR